MAYTHRNTRFVVFFVLYGLLDGERGMGAERTDGTRLRDGWYFMLEGDDDPTHVGVYKCKEDAIEAAHIRIDIDEAELHDA